MNPNHATMSNGMLVAVPGEPSSLQSEVLQHCFADSASFGLVFGSNITGDAHKASDVDTLVAVDDYTPETANALRESKASAERKLGMPVSVNIHTSHDIHVATTAPGKFIHRNRRCIFLSQAKYQAHLFLGITNPFRDLPDPPRDEYVVESVQMLMSISYFLRKYDLAPELAPHGKKEFIRQPLISLEYIAAYYGYIALGQRDAIRYLQTIGAMSEIELEPYKRAMEAKRSSVPPPPHLRFELISSLETILQRLSAHDTHLEGGR